MKNVIDNFFSITLRRVLILLLLILAVPFATMGNDTGTSTPASLFWVDSSTSVSTTTPPLATTTDQLILLVSDLGGLGTTTEEVLGDFTSEEMIPTVADEEVVDEEEPIAEEYVEPEIYVLAPQLPPLSVRKYTKEIVIDGGASHSCEAEVFRVDVSGKYSESARIIFSQNIYESYEMEIGGLPNGIDMQFDKTADYVYKPNLKDELVDITITVQSRAQKGDFTVPIIYTQKGIEDSSVICQINVVNL